MYEDLLGEAPAWHGRALCAQTDPEAYFPEKGGSTREAKRICNRCEVKAECLEYALDRDERFGIWGGLSERERRRLKRRGGGGEVPKVARVRRMAAGGMIDREIAAEEGMHPDAVGVLRRNNGIAPGRPEQSRKRAPEVVA